MRRQKVGEAMIAGGLREGVYRLETCDLVVGTERWAWGDEQAAAIDAHWTAQVAQNPAMFNGTIFVLGRHELRDAQLSASFLRTDFKTFLHWRDSGQPECGVRDCFGSALLRTADGQVLLGRQRAGNINAGLAYLPGGFIDARDVGPDGRIDIDASVLREVAEETGLDPARLVRRPGYILTVSRAQVSIALDLSLPDTAAAARRSIMAFLAADPQSELVDIVVVKNRAEAAAERLPPYAHVLLAALLD